jgi:polyisoprenoid-binding protein YceI
MHNSSGFHGRVRGLSVVLASALLLAACKSQIDDKPAASVKDAKPDAGKAAPDAKGGAKTAGVPVDAAASTVAFVGAKITDDHEGKFTEFSGDAVVENDVVKSISLEVKTTSVEVEPQKLEDHLRSADFFDVEKHPIATFRSTSITPKAEGDATHVVEGTLDLHGVQKTISFPAKITVAGGGATGTAQFTINRKDFGIVYAGMPDDLIKDDVLLKIDLKFAKA